MQKTEQNEEISCAVVAPQCRNKLEKEGLLLEAGIIYKKNSLFCLEYGTPPGNYCC
jgi:hypothetical protein